MGDVVRLIIDLFQMAWPFRLVHTWELGGYYVFGRWWKAVRPGVYPVIPWFMDVKTVSVAEALISTGRQDITLLNKATLSFSATMRAKVVDAYKALNLADNPHQTVPELLASVLADQLSEASVETLEGSKRKIENFYKRLESVAAEEGLRYGMELRDLRFTSYVMGMKTIRLLIDQSLGTGWS